MPSSVTPGDRTSATSSGRVQCGRLVGRRTLHERTARVSSAARRRTTRSSSSSENPPPTWPAIAQPAVRPRGSADAAARRTAARAPRGSVKPPMTNESRLTSFSLRHSPRPPPGTVRRARVLDDQALPAARARLREQRRAVAAHLRRQADDVAQRGRERRLQATPPFDQRQRAQICVPVAQEIEAPRTRSGWPPRAARSRAGPVR